MFIRKASNGYVNAQTLKEHMVKIHGVYRRDAGGVTDGDPSSSETGKNSPVPLTLPPAGKTQSPDAGAEEEQSVEVSDQQSNPVRLKNCYVPLRRCDDV